MIFHPVSIKQTKRCMYISIFLTITPRPQKHRDSVSLTMLPTSAAEMAPEAQSHPLQSPAKRYPSHYPAAHTNSDAKSKVSNPARVEGWDRRRIIWCGRMCALCFCEGQGLCGGALLDRLSPGGRGSRGFGLGQYTLTVLKRPRGKLCIRR